MVRSARAGRQADTRTGWWRFQWRAPLLETATGRRACLPELSVAALLCVELLARLFVELLMQLSGLLELLSCLWGRWCVCSLGLLV